MAVIRINQPGFLFKIALALLIFLQVSLQGQLSTRPNIENLPPDGTAIQSIRKGIDEMKKRPADDPLSWNYQSGIHATFRKLQSTQDMCQHGNYFFLPWHRMYLYFFERILRAASGDPNLVLAYWDCDNSRVLPLVFRQPADSNSNSLYIPSPGRSIRMNWGGPLPSPISSNQALSNTYRNFFSSIGSGQSFGGQWIQAPRHAISSDPHSQIESNPHDAVHTVVGGAQGLMSVPETAALDPIFWMHHANIDRLWEVWLRLGNGRSNPTNADWLNQTFQFYDENRRLVSMAVKEVLNTQNLGYTYSDLPPIRQFEAVAVSVNPPIEEAKKEKPKTVVSASKTENIKLMLKETTIPVEKQPVTEPRAHEGLTASSKPVDILLNLEDIQFNQAPETIYSVYLNVPKNQTPPYSQDHFVGILSFFAFKNDDKRSINQSYNITDLIQKLKDRGEWKEGNVEVTLVPEEVALPHGALLELRARPEARAPEPDVRISRVTITTQEK